MIYTLRWRTKLDSIFECTDFNQNSPSDRAALSTARVRLVSSKRHGMRCSRIMYFALVVSDEITRREKVPALGSWSHVEEKSHSSDLTRVN